MNNTTKRNLALAAVFMAAILVVGTFATTTTIATTQSAFAYPQKKKGGGLCNALERQFLSEAELRDALTTAQVSTTIANELIACLLQAGIVFPV